MERTYIMIKPDGVKRRLIGQIISRLENKGLYLVKSKILKPNEEILRSHYSAHVNKPFFKSLLEYMLSGQIVAMVWEGQNAVKIARNLIGATNPVEALPGTIRGDLAICTGKNLLHGSDSVEAAENEIKIWFGEEKIESELFDKEVIYE